jgi:hypothetical protein
MENKSKNLLYIQYINLLIDIQPSAQFQNFLEMFVVPYLIKRFHSILKPWCLINICKNL